MMMDDTPKFTPGPWAVHSMFKEYVVPQDAVSKPIGGSVYDVQDRDYYAQTIVRVAPDRHGRGDAAANAHLIAASPDMLTGGEAQTAIIHRAQAILEQYLIPDGIDGPEAINQLLGLLDGPDQRAAQASWDAALAKASGQ